MFMEYVPFWTFGVKTWWSWAEKAHFRQMVITGQEERRYIVETTEQICDIILKEAAV